MEARAVWSSVRQWIPAPDYLESLWEVFVHYWLKTTDGVQHTLTDPANFLPLLGCALLGIVVPVLLLIMWRLFNWQKKKAKEIVEEKAGKFNEKVLSSIKAKAKGKKPRKADESSHSKAHEAASSTAASPTPLLPQASIDEPEVAPASPNKRDPPSKSPSLSGSSVDSTRIMRNFELDEDAVKKLAGMEFHGKLKTATLRARAEKLEEGMTREEREKENELKKKQLEDIFKMMQNQGEKFGIENKADLYDQMKLYTK